MKVLYCKPARWIICFSRSIQLVGKYYVIIRIIIIINLSVLDTTLLNHQCICNGDEMDFCCQFIHANLYIFVAQRLQ